MRNFIRAYTNTSLPLRILAGLAAGIILAVFLPQANFLNVFGDVFVGALKSVAPLLVLVLVINSLANAASGIGKRFGTVMFLYLLSTLLAAATAVLVSIVFKVTLKLTGSDLTQSAPAGIGEVFKGLILNMVSNPVDALSSANYTGILFWAVLLGLAFKKSASDAIKSFLAALSDSVATVVGWIIELAPFGIMGLVFSSVSQSGIEIFTDYGRLLLLLISCMLISFFIINPFIVFLCLKHNPYPLLFKCLKGSAVTAFFTRSSAANIPVNMKLCEKLGLDRDMYSVSIPLGATINMNGAAITITVMTLAAVNTLGISVDIITALILSVVATLGACGSSGVTGGSLLLIPMACSLFNITPDTAMQVVSIGFIIGLVQDSFETALNSSGDVLFAAAAELRERKKINKS